MTFHLPTFVPTLPVRPGGDEAIPAPPAGVYDSLAALWADGAPAYAGITEGARRLLRRASTGVIVGCQRFCTHLGIAPGVWVPDGFYDAQSMGTQWNNIIGVGIDGQPSANGGAGSFAYTLIDGTGLRFASPLGATNNNSIWEWPITSSPIAWSAIDGYTVHAVVRKGQSFDGLIGQQLGQHDDGGVNRNAIQSLFDGGTNAFHRFVWASGTASGPNNTAKPNNARLDHQHGCVVDSNNLKVNNLVTPNVGGTPSDYVQGITIAAANRGVGQTFSRFGLIFSETFFGAVNVDFLGLYFSISEA